MKIKIGEEVYLQNYEIKYLVHDLSSFPDSILQEIFDEDRNNFFMSGPANGFWFECAFRNANSVKWLMEQDWIVDYDEYARKPLPELEALVKHLKAEHAADINEFNAKDKTYRKDHFKEASDKFDKASHKISSLENLIAASKGEVNFVFPSADSAAK